MLESIKKKKKRPGGGWGGVCVVMCAPGFPFCVEKGVDYLIAS